MEPTTRGAPSPGPYSRLKRAGDGDDDTPAPSSRAPLAPVLLYQPRPPEGGGGGGGGLGRAGGTPRATVVGQPSSPPPLFDHATLPSVAHRDSWWRSTFSALTSYRLVWGSPSFRAVLLTLVLIPVGSGYLAFDVPAITAEALKARLSLSNSELGALFAVYALPNIILPLASGA